MKIAGVKIKVEKTTYRAFFILVLIPFFVIGGYTAIFYPAEVGVGTFLNALLVGVGFAVYHAIAQLVHQLGHALAARATGYPRRGYAMTISLPIWSIRQTNHPYQLVSTFSARLAA